MQIEFKILKFGLETTNLAHLLPAGHAWACLGIPGHPRELKVEHVQVQKALRLSLGL